MDAKQLKAVCERLGFGIAHARRVPRSSEVRAYVAVRHKDDCRYGDVDELRWRPETPDGHLELWQHAVKPNGYTQYDKYVGLVTVADLV